ncbi:MAG TPA: M18 family aminopeptidase, partial [Fibrobacteraceae bacterium]|nr:M18 family aminopeptidase [Fibrobacteraceae bacterium]
MRFSPDTRLHLVAAHTDFPALHIKPHPSVFREGYHLLNVEVYGSPILSTWIDRDLCFGGQLVFRHKGERDLRTRLVDSNMVVRIPSLAVHLQDSSKENSLNAQTQMMPVLGLSGGDVYFHHLLESHLNPGEDLVDWDLQLYDSAKASLSGLSNEFVLSSRIDNLAMAHAAVRALQESTAHGTNLSGVMLFHNEEVGSLSWQGAQSTMASQVLERIFNAFQASRDMYFATLNRSFCISADMAHAVHPAYEDRHDPTHHPRINGGPVLKVNAARHYATEAVTSAHFRELCRMANVDLQTFVARNDQRCGSTIGPALAALAGIPTVDVGNPMLSMHSIREMMGSEDHDTMIRLLKTFFAQE